MRKSRFSEEQIIGILREQEAGRPTVALKKDVERALMRLAQLTAFEVQ